MAILRPRLNDFHRLQFGQADVDFAIPFVDEDIPLHIDPFLLWKSPSLQDSSLHLSIINSFNYLGAQFAKGNHESLRTLIHASECNEVGLGNSKTKSGKRIGEKVAKEILSLYKTIPQVNKSGFIHFEEIQLLVDNIAEDRVSDIAANLMNSFLIDYTIDQCEKVGLPIQKIELDCFDNKSNTFKKENVYLPLNPGNKTPILLVPKRWLRYSTYINYDEYFKDHYIQDAARIAGNLERVKVLNFNRQNYDQVEAFIRIKERQKLDCINDPLFKQIPVLSATRKLTSILRLPTGKVGNADKDYEDYLSQMLASLLYPNLDFAIEQSRTQSGVSIRDLIFYNNNSHPFLKELHEKYQCYQIVFEMKNVRELETDHIDQLNRYLKDDFGKFGIIFTRNTPPKNVLRNSIDLWAAHRKCILVLTDEDLKMMTELYESRQRHPIDVIKKKYIEFTRLLPS